MHSNFSKLFSILLILSWVTCSFQLAIRDYAARAEEYDKRTQFDSQISNGTIKNHILPPTPLPQVVLTKSPGGNWVGPLFIHGQQFTVTYDLGSDVIYVPLDRNDPSGNGCINCGTLREYTATGMTTGTQSTITYGAGAVAQGTVYQDTVAVTNTGTVQAVNNQQFVAAKSVPNIKVLTNVDGVLGMAIHYVAQPNKAQLPLFFPSFFDTYAANYNNRMLSFYPDTVGGNGAKLTIGGDYDAITARGVSTFSVTGLGGHWSLNLNAVNIPANNNNYLGPNIGTTQYYADFDSGSSSIFVPRAAWTALFQSLAGFRLDNGNYVGACNTFPSLTFTIGDASKTSQFVVPGSILQPPDNLPAYVGTRECRTLLQPDDTTGDTWTLGTPFLSSVYSQFILGATNQATTVTGYKIGLKSLYYCPPAAQAAQAAQSNTNGGCVIA